MLAIVKSSMSIRSPLQYNEQKVKQEQAHFLDARNFLQEKEELTMRHKLQRFQDLAALNERSARKAIHISVNFSESDLLTNREMVTIAGEFMQGIGFADQPWLAYRHFDAGHPHMHIVTTNIRPDGSRILNDLRSPYHLKELCSQIEESHSLVHALRMRDPSAQEYTQTPGHASILRYGEKPTKTGIAEVLGYVNENYAFTSFETYNAVLGLYHVRADRGREDGAMYQNRGLYYRMIDEEGKKVGAPIKASDFDWPVTLDKLEEKFSLSEKQVQQSLNHLSTSIDWKLFNPHAPYSLAIFGDEMRKENVEVVIPALTQRDTRGPKPADTDPKPDDGHGIFYIDFNSMTAVRDTDLGQRYTAAAVLERTGVEKELRTLYENRQLSLRKPGDEAALQPDYPDTAETRRVLLKLSAGHNRYVEQERERLQEEQSLRHGHHLHL